MSDEVASDKMIGLVMAESLNRAWKAIQERHPEVPDSVMTVAVSHKGNVLGHFGKDFWEDVAQKDDAGKFLRHHEVLIAADHLQRGPADVLETCLHEAAHALNAARGQKGTTGRGYHNGLFKAAAEELGLVVTKQGRIGFAHTELSDDTAKAYDAVIDDLAIAIKATRVPPLVEAKKRTAPIRATCSCGRGIRISRTVLEAGPIVCGLCDTPFKSDAAEEDSAASSD